MSVRLIHHLLERAVGIAPARTFIVQIDGRFSYEEIDEGANRIANVLLESGLSLGDRVGLLAHNSNLYVEAYYGILKAGGVAVPINTAVDAKDLGYYLGDCGARVLIAGPRMDRVLRRAAADLDLRVLIQPNEERLSGLPEQVQSISFDLVAVCDARRPERIIDPDSLASIIYTSGSTGRPRGVMLSHDNIVENTRSIVGYLDLGETDRVLAVLPFYYVYGKSILNTHAFVGGTVVIENRFQYPNVALDTLEAESCTGFSGVPSTFAILLNRSTMATRELRSLRYVTQAGGALSPALIRRLIDALPGKRIFVMYGATEASARLSYVAPDELADSIGSIGRAIPNVSLTVQRPDGSECECDEVGELVARGPNIMQGYWGAPGETAAALRDGSYYTGDLARRDARGLLYIEGRKRDMIKARGHRVAAREIEEAIAEHPEVHEVAVIGVPDEIHGEQIKAVVVCREGSTLADQALNKFLAQHLAAYKLPHIIEFVPSLPKNESGKIMKERLRGGPPR